MFFFCDNLEYHYTSVNKQAIKSKKNLEAYLKSKYAINRFKKNI